MAKLLVEENIKSKHPDSFKILKGHGYKLTHRDDKNSEYYGKPGSSRAVTIDPNGKWGAHHISGGEYTASGKSHSDLKVHLDKLHN